jgi:hypothetical protein
LSNIEGLITEIDAEYWKLRKLVEGCLKQTEGAGLAEREAISFFDRVVKFQTFLEGKEIQGKSFSGVAYYKRYSDRFAGVLKLVTSQSMLKVIYGSEHQYERADDYEHWDDKQWRWVDHIMGLVQEAEALVDRSNRGIVTAQERSLTGMLSILKDMEIELIKLNGDLRLMSGMTFFGVEKRTRVHDNLFKFGLKDALGYLDDAEANLRLENPHLKDSLHNCRLAIESVIYALAKRENVKVINKFSVDLSELSEKNPAPS